MTHRYDEPITCEVDRDERPMGFVWRGRRYRVNRVIEHWVSTREWWRRDSLHLGISTEIRLYRLAAESSRGRGVAEVSHDVDSDTWKIKRIWD